jgi:signal transduction histidine kinase
LLGLEERVQRLQGSFAIESAPGARTTLKVTVRDAGNGNLGS